MKFLISVILLVTLHSAAMAQPDAIDELLYHGYLARDQTLIKKAIAISEKALNTDPGSKDLRFRLAMCRFAMLNSTMADQNEDLYDNFEDETEELLDDLTKSNKTWGEPKALLSAKYGLDIAYTPIKGILLGSKSASLMEEALKDSPSSPVVWKLYANSKLFTPESYGGDVRTAIDAYQKAIALFEAQDNTKGNWMYIDALAFIGQAYERTGDLTNAELSYQKALTVEPAFGWVKTVLMPKLRQKQSSR